MSAQFEYDNPNPDIATAEWYVREMSQDGWTESIRMVRSVEEARRSNYGTVTRTYGPPDWNLEDFEETRISVLPVESAPSRSARCVVVDEVNTDIVLAKRVRPDKIDRTSDLIMKLSQQIEHWFECHPHATIFCEPCQLQVRWMNGTRPRIYSLEHVSNMHLVVTTIRFMAICMKNTCCCV